MSYLKFRESLEGDGFVEDLYVEMRGAKGRESISGIFDVYEFRSDALNMEDALAENSYRSRIRLDICKKLQKLSSVFYVFCDFSKDTFMVSNEYEEINSYKKLGSADYANVINELPGTYLTGRSPQPPKHPDAMSKYSVWHYSLDWACKCRDIDYLEIRNGEVKAALEITGRLNGEQHLLNSKQQIRNRLELQGKILSIFSDFFSCPAYFILHTTDLNVFYVFDLDWVQRHRLTKEEYIVWLECL